MIATAERNEVWKPSPKQAEFIAASESEVLMGGGLGSGKSLAALMAAAHAIGNGAHRALLVRRSFPQLRDMIAKSLEIFPYLGGVWNEQKSTHKFPSGARIEFGFLESPLDHSRFLGRQFNFIAVDELGDFPGDALDGNDEPINSGYQFLMTRQRTTKSSGLPLEMRATACAIGPGRDWIRRRWQIPDDGSASTCVDPTTGFHRRFIPALLKDNPHIEDAGYRKTLEGLPRAQRVALLEGRWDSCVGGIFEELDHSLHIVDPFEIPSSWPRWRACDDGWSAPLACCWLTHDQDGTDTIYVVREIYQRKLTPEAAAELILETDRSLRSKIGFGAGVHIRHEEGETLSGVIDSSAFSTFGSGPSRASRMNELGCRWRPVEKGPGSVIAGLAEIHRRLTPRSDGTVGLKIFKGCCPALVRELSSAVYSTTNPEEIAPGCSTHALDALRYGCTSRPLRAGRVRVM